MAHLYKWRDQYDEQIHLFLQFCPEIFRDSIISETQSKLTLYLALRTVKPNLPFELGLSLAAYPTLWPN